MKTKTSLTLGAVALFCVNPLLSFRSPGAELRVPDQYSSIQEAVNASSSGDVIRIAPLDFHEQIVIVDKTNLTLIGEPGTVLHATAGMTETLLPYGFNGYAVVAVHRSDVVISSLAIVGESLGGSYSTPLNGLDLFGAGGLVTNCAITGFRGTTDTITATVGRGVHCFNPVSTGAPAVNLAIVNNTFTNNQIAMHLRGDPGSNPGLLRATAKVQGNTIVGLGPAPGWNVGVWLVCGVVAEVIGNNISDFAGTSTFDCAGIGAHDAAAQGRNPKRFVSLFPCRYEGNTFSNCGQGLWVVGGDESQIVNNKFVGTVQGTFLPRALGVSGTNIVVANNNFSDLPNGIMPVDENWDGWPTLPPVVDSSFTANWFCYVPEPIRTNLLVTGLQEQGTEQCENGPLRPVFQSISGRDAAPPASASLILRSWHDQRVIIESSANLQQWIPVRTNMMTLPTLEIEVPAPSGAPHQFYRARQQ